MATGEHPDLTTLRRRFRAAVRATGGVDAPADSEGWSAWNGAVRTATALAEEMARQRAGTPGELIIRFEAMHWYFDQHDVFNDLEASRQFRTFGRDLRRIIREII